MEVTEVEARACFVRARKWIRDAEAYSKLAGRPQDQALQPTALSAEDLQRMLDAGQIEPIDPKQARGSVKVFSVPEVAKNRRRAIKHTEEINRLYPKETLEPVRLPLRDEQTAQATTGRFALCLDFAAYFDQFELASEVSDLLCFRKGPRAYRLRRMPMGQRHAVGVAQSATNVLLSFVLPAGVSVQSCIDNVRFVGPRDGVLEAAVRFVQRCRYAKVTINDLPAGAGESAALAAMVHQEGDWLGATYDYRTSRQRLAQKTVEKLRASWSRRGEWTNRLYAAHMGLLFFAASVLYTPLGMYFEALKQLRLRSQRLTEDPSEWDAPVGIHLSEEKALLRWTNAATANQYVPCRTQLPAERVLLTDASDWGWGAILFDAQTGTTHMHGAPWTGDDRAQLNTAASAHCEPEAVFRALCRFIVPGDTRPLLVLTDSTTARYALARGYSPSFAVNAIAARVRHLFGDVPMRFAHVAGDSNVADALSRGAAGLEPTEAQVKVAGLAALEGEPLLRRAMGYTRPV